MLKRILLAATVTVSLSTAALATDQMVFTAWGGTTQDTQKKALRIASQRRPAWRCCRTAPPATASSRRWSRAAKAKYVLGLSATVSRKDGHHPIIFMQCGPVRYHVDSKKQALSRPFGHKVIFRETAFQRSAVDKVGKVPIQQIYAELARDERRNDLIFDDILAALDAGHSPLLITERKEHLAYFADRLSRFAKNIITLHGGMGTKQRCQRITTLRQIPDGTERVLIATGRYLGEGFDDARLDTLFLAMPISWKGTLAHPPMPTSKASVIAIMSANP